MIGYVPHPPLALTFIYPSPMMTMCVYKRHLLFYHNDGSKSTEISQNTSKTGGEMWFEEACQTHVSQFPGHDSWFPKKWSRTNCVRAIINLHLRKFKIHYSLTSTHRRLTTVLQFCRWRDSGNPLTVNRHRSVVSFS